MVTPNLDEWPFIKVNPLGQNPAYRSPAYYYIKKIIDNIGAFTLTQTKCSLQGYFDQKYDPYVIRRICMAKPTTVKIRLNSSADTGHFYVTKKNARTMTEKMVVRKYDPVARKHVEYKEGKIK